MCGFLGVFQPHRNSGISVANLQRSRELLFHRGPDQQDIYCGDGIGLVHTRLSLLDLSERSRQPFWDAGKRYALVYNGEIYNFKELRRELEQEGVVFRTTGDTEVLLEMLIHRGVDRTLSQIEGMYAFALYDSMSHTLTLARDRFGMKPLYTWRKDGTFIFSSAISAMRPWIEFEPDLLAVLSYLQGHGTPYMGYSFYKGLRIVEPGAVITVCGDGAVLARRHFQLSDLWNAERAEELRRLSLEETVDLAERMLLDNVRMQLVADAPVGVLCSGGVDSSTIMAMAARFNSNVTVFHAHVVGPVSEYDAAKALAEHLKLDFRCVDVQDSDYLDVMPDVMEHYGHPFAQHLNSVPFLSVSRLVRSSGVKAVLSGEGADESYYGYPEMIVRPGQPKWYLPRRLHKYAATLQWLMGSRAVAFETDVRKDLATRYERSLEYEEIRKNLDERGGRVPDDFQSLCWLGYHLRSLLHRNDCLGMAASIEARFPYLDTALVRDAVNMPYNVKARFSLEARDVSHHLIRDKWVLRQVARRYIPDWLARRRKSGFQVEAWRRMVIPVGFFRHVCDILELSEKEMRHLFEHARPLMRTKLLHLEVWAHLCLYGLEKERILAKLRDEIAIQPASNNVEKRVSRYAWRIRRRLAGAEGSRSPKPFLGA